MEGPVSAPSFASLGRGEGRALYLRTQMRLREMEFVETHSLTLFVGTWNVNGKMPKEALAPWLLPSGVDAAPPADVVALGLQEFDTSTSALILSETSRAEPWIAAISATINRLPEIQYVLVAKQQLGGILETIWIRSTLVQHMKDLQIHYSSTGIGNVLANKGGTAVRMDLYDSSFCFVVSHLNAHDENVLRRNQDFASIVNDVKFSDNRGIWDHQFLFWFGDLNYRIALPRPRILMLIESENWGELVANDQLNEQRRLGAAFSEFSEGKIAWAPTYRYDNGTNTYDTSEKQRKPSYTDRVLHKTERASDLTLLYYRRVSEMLLSDHKPVFAIYSAKAREIRQADYAKIYADVSRNMDKMENDYQPQAVVSSTVLDFNQVRYGVPSVVKFKLTNSGIVLFNWKFKAKPVDSGAPQVSKPWLRVEPSSGSLMPDESAEISVVIMIEGWELASAMGVSSQRREALEDILVLHLENGKDFFLSVQGQYLPTSFGCLLDHLVRIPQPVRSMSTLLKPEDSLRIPKEIWLLADWLYKHPSGLSEPELFLQRGIPDEMIAVREALDTGSAFSSSWSPHSVAETLLELLRSLAQPVIPIVYYAQAIEPNAPHSFCKQIVEALPEVNYNVFWYLVALAREVLSRQRESSANTEDLALALGQALLRPPNEPRYRKPNVIEQHDVLKMRFVKKFLTSNET